VNLPEFLLLGYDASGRPQLRMKIIAGAAYRHQTPTLSATLDHVIFRPYWNVPLSIQRNELIPLISKALGYIAKHQYEVVTPGGKLVARRAVPKEILPMLQSGDLLLRQTPGPANALGLVKFMFPNRQNVYLHDTPARELFSKARRDFSHGCMRVERPINLAEWVIREELGWNRERIEAAMSGTETIRVDLKRRIPVLVVYGTAVAVENGDAHFMRDIYGYDAALARELAARRGPVPR
jgi:L,D-transpeptidase YcbB